MKMFMTKTKKAKIKKQFCTLIDLILITKQTTKSKVERADLTGYTERKREEYETI